MKKILIALLCTVFTIYGFSLAGNYTTEQQNAYNYAYNQKITTVSSIEKANMNGSLTRIAMAKMISNFAVNVLGLQPDTSKDCTFIDVSNSLNAQYNYGVKQACQLGLMGIGNDGKKSVSFNPNGKVTRAQFATAFSRALSNSNGDTVLNGQPYYKRHLLYLNAKGIINDINNPNPNSVEKRGNVMIMMMRNKNLNNGSSNTDRLITCSDSKGTINLNKNTGERIYNYEYKDGEYTCSFIDNKYTCNDTNGNTIHPKFENNIELYSCNNDKIIVSVGAGTWGVTYLDTVRDLGIGTPVNGNSSEEEYISFYTNGQIKEKGQNEYGKKTGEWIEYYEKGQIKEKGQNEYGKKTGEWIEYYEKGQIKEKGHYKNGEKDGEWVGYYENGKMRYKETYKNGKLNGEQILYETDGSIYIAPLKDGEIYFDLEKYGTFNNYSRYSENGKISSASFVDENMKLNGDYILFYKNGNIQEQGAYKDNKQDGEWITYYENGQIKSKGSYRNGIKEGKRREYFEDGSIASKGSYKNGKLDGYWIRYCEKGDTQCTSLDGNYKNGEKIRD